MRKLLELILPANIVSTHSRRGRYSIPYHKNKRQVGLLSRNLLMPRGIQVIFPLLEDFLVFYQNNNIELRRILRVLTQSTTHNL